MVGFVLGLRTFSQQGLFVVGGALVDRYGVRPIVLTGCALRVAGFAWLGRGGGGFTCPAQLYQGWGDGEGARGFAGRFV